MSHIKMSPKMQDKLAAAINALREAGEFALREANALGYGDNRKHHVQLYADLEYRADQFLRLLEEQREQPTPNPYSNVAAMQGEQLE